MQPLNGRNLCSWAQATLSEYKCIIPLSALTSFIQQWRTVPIFLHLVHGLWELSFEIKSDQINLLAKLCLRVWQLMKEEDLDPPTTGLRAPATHGYSSSDKFPLKTLLFHCTGPRWLLATVGQCHSRIFPYYSTLYQVCTETAYFINTVAIGVTRSECTQPGCGQWELVNRAGRKVHQQWIVLNKSLRTSLIPEEPLCKSHCLKSRFLWLEWNSPLQLWHSCRWTKLNLKTAELDSIFPSFHSAGDRIQSFIHSRKRLEDPKLLSDPNIPRFLNTNNFIYKEEYEVIKLTSTWSLRACLESTSDYENEECQRTQ